MDEKEPGVQQKALHGNSQGTYALSLVAGTAALQPPVPSHYCKVMGAWASRVLICQGTPEIWI